MEILQLRYFLESAKNESFAKTAQKFMVPSASVSASVKRLETELGCQLFHRASNKIILNDKGRAFKESLSVAFSEIDSVIDRLTSHTTDTRNIKILVRSMRNTITDYIVEYKSNHPNIVFNTVFDFDNTDIEDYDIIIDERTDRYKNYERYDLFKTKIKLCAASSDPLCGKKLMLKQLSQQPFVSIGEHNGMHEMFVNACKREGFTPKIVVHCNDLKCNRKFIKSGIGIGLCRAYPWGEKTDGISMLDVSDFKETQTICCYYKKEFAYGNIEHFIKFLKKKVNE